MGGVKVALADRVLTATLADHENRNALGAEILAGLKTALERANADPEIRVVVLTNEGSTFCAGANLKEQSARNESGESTAISDFAELLTAIQCSPTPVVGRIDGHVVGGGNGLAAACDIAIAREDVKFGFTEVRLGVTPAIISVVCLPKMRRGEAMEAFLRGNRFSAAKAAEYGLISRALPGDELDAAVMEVVGDLRKGGPEALVIAKRLVYEIEGREPQEAFEWATQLSAECFASDEAREGMRAFIEKRGASWAASEED
ncbi:MAG: enoyl-CoA hydratase [bacterium]|nr:enoyl-CoA hydratase [Deltaproteobacteria bacterium]MCP4904248.1 enoyl-CoA hydratase [bacterium]